MKQFMQSVMKWKTSACLMFTATVIIYLLINMIFKVQEVPVTMLWSLLFICVIGSLLQAVCFSDWIIKKMRYTRRSLLFVLLFLPSLSLTALKMNWFPAEQLGSWMTFLGTFFLTYIVMTIGYDIYFRITGRKYDGLVGQYRREKELEEMQNPPQQA